MFVQNAMEERSSYFHYGPEARSSRVGFIISAAALFALLPWLKEGYDLGELARFAGVTADSGWWSGSGGG